MWDAISWVIPCAYPGIPSLLLLLFGWIHAASSRLNRLSDNWILSPWDIKSAKTFFLSMLSSSIMSSQAPFALALSFRDAKRSLGSLLFSKGDLFDLLLLIASNNAALFSACFLMAPSTSSLKLIRANKSGSFLSGKSCTFSSAMPKWFAARRRL